MVVTMGAQGAVFATLDGEEGYCPAKKVDVKDTTGENVCPRYLPSEFGLDASAPDDAQLALEL